jgi:hypothetical protein
VDIAKEPRFHRFQKLTQLLTNLSQVRKSELHNLHNGLPDQWRRLQTARMTTPDTHSCGGPCPSAANEDRMTAQGEMLTAFFALSVR